MKPLIFSAAPPSNLQKKQTFISQHKKRLKGHVDSVQDLIKLNTKNLEKSLPFLLHYK